MRLILCVILLGCQQGQGSGAACQPVEPHVLIDTDHGAVPRCELGDWPASFVLPPPDPIVPDSLPAPFDDPEAGADPSIGGTIYTAGAGARGDFMLQTLWTDADHPPVLRLGRASSSAGRFDAYCLVDGMPHACSWREQNGQQDGPWISYQDAQPVRAWAIELLAPPVGGFDWTLLWAERQPDRDPAFPMPHADGSIERIYIYNEATTVLPRFDPLLWNLATPEGRVVDVLVEPYRLYTPILRDGDRAELDLRLRNDESCSIPLEITFLAEGRVLERVSPGGDGLVWSVEVSPGDQRVTVELAGVSDLPSGAPLFIHGIAYPGVPGMGVTGSGEGCISATAGIIQGIDVGPLALFE